MATIQSIKLSNEENIRSKTAPGSILKTVDANMRDVVANEIRDRGIVQVASTDDLATQAKENTKSVLVASVGLFIIIESEDEPDDDTTFASADEGWIWVRVLGAAVAENKSTINLSGDGSYEIEDGTLVDKILIKCTAADTIKIGTTDGGDEVMMEDTLVANKWKSVTTDLLADGEDVLIYFTGISDEAQVIIYKRSL